MESTACGVCIDYCSYSVTGHLPQIMEGRTCFGSSSEDTVSRQGRNDGRTEWAAGRMASPVRKQEEANAGTWLAFSFLLV